MDDVMFDKVFSEFDGANGAKDVARGKSFGLTGLEDADAIDVDGVGRIGMVVTVNACGFRCSNWAISKNASIESDGCHCTRTIRATLVSGNGIKS
jgi:hypothetical protein